MLIGIIRVKKTKNNLFILVKGLNWSKIISFGYLNFTSEKRKTYYAYYMLSLAIAKEIKKKSFSYWGKELKPIHIEFIFDYLVENKKFSIKSLLKLLEIKFSLKITLEYLKLVVKKMIISNYGFWLEFSGRFNHKRAILKGFLKHKIIIVGIVFKDLTLHGGCKLKKKRRKLLFLLMVRILPFQGNNMGSNPIRVNRKS